MQPVNVGPLQQKFAKRIIKALEPCAYQGRRQSDIWSDFVELSTATWQAMLRLTGESLASTASERSIEMDTHALDVGDRILDVYGQDGLEAMSAAFDVLLESVQMGYMDVLGSVYMQYGHPNSWTGQFFTPWNVASMMAQMIDAGDSVESKLKAALLREDNILGHATMLGNLAFPHVLDEIDEDREKYAAWVEMMRTRLVPAAVAGGFEPVTVCDPCVGSGVMLLAHAAAQSRWMHDLGLIRYYGMDIDRGCVQMAQLNMSLYLLNVNMYSVLDIDEDTLQSLPLPEPQMEVFEEARAADEAGDEDRVSELSRLARQGKLEQQVMF